MAMTQSDQANNAVVRMMRQLRIPMRPDTPEGAAIASVVGEIGSMGSTIDRYEMQLSKIRYALKSYGYNEATIDSIMRGEKRP